MDVLDDYPQPFIARPGFIIGCEHVPFDVTHDRPHSVPICSLQTDRRERVPLGIEAKVSAAVDVQLAE